MEYIIREMKKSEYALLSDFLYEAIFIQAGEKVPPKSIIATPELQIYIDRFGESKDDHCCVAEIKGKVVGAVWVRIMNDYGHIDDDTPSMAISLYKEYRGIGIGKALLESMAIRLKEYGYESVSLAVQKENYAVKLYKKVGFEMVDENEEEYIMRLDLQRV